MDITITVLHYYLHLSDGKYQVFRREQITSSTLAARPVDGQVYDSEMDARKAAELLNQNNQITLPGVSIQWVMDKR